MRPLPGDDAFGRQRTADADPSPLANSISNSQMSFVLADEASVDSLLEHSTSQQRPRDTRKATDPTNAAPNRKDEKDGEASRQPATRQPEREFSIPYSPVSRASGMTRSPASFRSHNQSSFSRPMTPINLGTPGPGSFMSSPSSRRDSLTSSLYEHAIESEAEQEEETPGPAKESHSAMLDSGSAPQLVMPSIKMPSRRPFTEIGKSLGRFKVLLAGNSGVGKTALIKAIVQSCEHIVHVDPISPPPQSRRSSKATEKAVIGRRTSDFAIAISEIFASTKPYPEWRAQLEEVGNSHRRKSLNDSILERNICFVDTPGYSAGSSAMETITPCVDYIESHLNRVSSDSLDDSEMLSMLGGNGGFQVDVVFYLVSGDLQPADVEYIRRVSKLTNVIPLLSKSDGMLPAEISSHKRQIEGLLEESGIRPFSFDLRGQGQPASHVTTCYATSSMAGSDHDMMDASVLMNPDYVQPLVSSELKVLVERVFNPDGVSWLRHSAAKKYLQWRKASASSRPRHLYQPMALPEPGPSNALVRASRDWDLAVYRGSRPDAPAKFHVVDWAADLQRSMATERAQYESMARAERAIWLTEKLDECARDGTLIAVKDGLQEATVATTRKRGRRSRAATKTSHHQDPLGLLQVAADVRSSGWVAVEVLGSIGVLGGLAFWLTSQYSWPPDHMHAMSDWFGNRILHGDWVLIGT